MFLEPEQIRRRETETIKRLDVPVFRTLLEVRNEITLLSLHDNDRARFVQNSWVDVLYHQALTIGVVIDQTELLAELLYDDLAGFGSFLLIGSFARGTRGHDARETGFRIL